MSIELLVWEPCETESLSMIFFLISAPLWKWQMADAAAQRTTLAPWCLCLGHLTQTNELMHSFGFWVVSLIHLSRSLDSLRVMKVGFKTSRDISGKQSSCLYVFVSVAWSCCHLHHECSPGGQKRCFVGSFEFTLWCSIAITYFFYCINNNIDFNIDKV